MRASSSTRAARSSGTTSLADRLALAGLGHAEVAVGVGGDLRQVRDAQHLAALAERLQQAADRGGNRAADAGVHLVEDQRGHRRDLARRPPGWRARCATARRPTRRARADRAPAWDARRPCSSTCSSPKLAGGSCGSSAISRRPPAIASSCIAFVTRWPSSLAAKRRLPVSCCATLRYAASASAARRASASASPASRECREARLRFGRAARAARRGARGACARRRGWPSRRSSTRASSPGIDVEAAAVVAQRARRLRRAGCAAGSSSAAISAERGIVRRLPRAAAGSAATSRGASASSSSTQRRLAGFGGCDQRRGVRRAAHCATSSARELVVVRASSAASSCDARSRGTSRSASVAAAAPAAASRSSDAARHARQASATSRASAVKPPKPSTSARCASGAVSVWCACWPCSADQPLAERRELRERGGAAVDPCATATAGVEHAAQQQRVVAAAEVVLGEPRAHARRVVDVELGGELGALGTGTQLPQLEAVAEQQAERVEQDGLAGARFAGEHREAARRARGRAIRRRRSCGSTGGAASGVPQALGGFAPVELLAQHREVVVAFRVQEARAVRRAAQHHAVAFATARSAPGRRSARRRRGPAAR